MAGARKRRVRGRFYSVLDAVKGMLADVEPRVRKCERRRTERIERREVVRDLDHGHDGHDQRPSSNSRSIRRSSDATKLGGGRAAPYRVHVVAEGADEEVNAQLIAADSLI